MIIRCITNRRVDLPEAISDMAYPEGVTDDLLDLTIGMHYSVYAIKADKSSTRYFIQTNTPSRYALRWMPSELFEVKDSSKPKGWEKHQDTPANILITYWAYPSLFDWKIENGIIDNEAWAINIYMKEVKADPTFPSEDDVSRLNTEIPK